MKYADMVKVIKEGGSVLHQGKVLSRIEELPSEADLAQGDAQASVQVRERLLEQRAFIDRELQKVGGVPALEGAVPPGRGDSELARENEELRRLLEEAHKKLDEIEAEESKPAHTPKKK